MRRAFLRLSAFACCLACVRAACARWMVILASRMLASRSISGRSTRLRALRPSCSGVALPAFGTGVAGELAASASAPDMAPVSIPTMLTLEVGLVTARKAPSLQLCRLQNWFKLCCVALCCVSNAVQQQTGRGQGTINAVLAHVLHH